MTGEVPPLALVRVIRRNRRRYGGYIVHAGVAVLLVGVAASSSFQHSRQVSLAPGQSTTVDGYAIRYVRPTEQLAVSDGGSLKYIALGAVLDVSKQRHHVTTLDTSRRFYPATLTPGVGPVSIAFGGEADSQVGLRAGLTRDIWTVVNPNLTPLQPFINRGDRVFERLMRSLTPAQAAQPATRNWIQGNLGAAIRGIAGRYASSPWPVTFLLIVDPLVTWIWLGAIIVVLGGLLALWPIPSGLRRRRRAELPVRRPALPRREPVLEPVASVAARPD
jgi:cytochrome c-type biogenesis protein CcmF